MEGLSVWSAQALQSLDSDSSLKVKYCQSSREVLEEVQHAGPPILRKIGDPRYYDTKKEKKKDKDPQWGPYDTNDPNASPSSLSSGAFEAMPSPEPYRQHEGVSRYLKNTNKIPQEKRAYDITMILPQLFVDDHYQSSLDPHDHLQRRIDSIEAFLSKQFPNWKELLETPIEKPPMKRQPGKPTGVRDPDEDGMGYKYAIVYGETTEFNPSGIWVVEEFYNNDDM